jgi:YVTN family beta-propeller protein
VVASVGVGSFPFDGIATNPRLNTIYVANWFSNSVSVIDGRTNTVLATVGVGNLPQGVAVNTRTNAVYVANQDSNTVSVLTP